MLPPPALRPSFTMAVVAPGLENAQRKAASGLTKINGEGFRQCITVIAANAAIAASTKA
jgi:hypothetical protein